MDLIPSKDTSHALTKNLAYTHVTLEAYTHEVSKSFLYRIVWLFAGKCVNLRFK